MVFPAVSGKAEKGRISSWKQAKPMTEQPRIRVFCVDDHPLLRQGIETVINSQPDMLLVGEASNSQEAIQQFRKHHPDVTLMDLRLPDMSGIETMIALRAEFPEARVIMLTTFEGDVEIQRALEAVARGFTPNSMSPKVMAGGRPPRHPG